MSSQAPTSNIKYGMVIDLDKCTGCGTCSVSCMTENNIYILEDETDKNRSITWLRIYRLENGEAFPNAKVAYLPRPCMHCDAHAPCVSVCPPIATTQDEIGGIVSQITTRCIGCRYCMAACPYHVRYFNWFDPWPLYMEHVNPMTEALNPDVAPRMRGVVEKCTFCHHRLMAAKDKAYTGGKRIIPEDDYQTACTQACPAKAITFGDLNNPEHQVHKLLKARKSHAFRLLEKLKTEPKVWYLSSQEWIRKKGDNSLDLPKGKGY
ncbi:MAG: 4Fe-4S dicluster domain-containing protein [Deltaproteobacteria bacterium]|nr:4Fe-4S dicluster domain-containing protein [Deltaproteobacteria bacterium]